MPEPVPPITEADIEQWQRIAEHDVANPRSTTRGLTKFVLRLIPAYRAVSERAEAAERERDALLAALEGHDDA